MTLAGRPARRDAAFGGPEADPRIVAGRTTNMRLLESAEAETGEVRSYAGGTRLFIQPGDFRAGFRPTLKYPHASPPPRPAPIEGTGVQMGLPTQALPLDGGIDIPTKLGHPREPIIPWVSMSRVGLAAPGVSGVGREASVVKSVVLEDSAAAA